MHLFKAQIYSLFIKRGPIRKFAPAAYILSFVRDQQVSEESSDVSFLRRHRGKTTNP